MSRLQTARLCDTKLICQLVERGVEVDVMLKLVEREDVTACAAFVTVPALCVCVILDCPGSVPPAPAAADRANV